jgi:hypothetical protein
MSRLFYADDSKTNTFDTPALFKHRSPQDIFFISLCAIICGADNWVAKEEWFTELLNLEHGIPSHDSFGAVYGAINTEQLVTVFRVGLPYRRRSDSD